MAGGLLEYSGLVTKTKAMRARLLGADDYTAISEYESVTDFIAFLREQPAYAPYLNGTEAAHRGWGGGGILGIRCIWITVSCTGFPVYSQEEHCSLCFHAMRSM